MDSRHLLNNVYAFFGADAKVGVTMMTTCIAQSISDQGIDVLHMHLDGKLGNEYYDNSYEYDYKCMDDLKLKLKSGIITVDDIKGVCTHNEKHIHHMAGVLDILKKNDYTPHQMYKLLEYCNMIFDFVIVDCGSDIHLGMSISGLLSTENRFLIMTQQHMSIKRFYAMNQIFQNIDINFADIIINKYIPYEQLPYAEDISNIMGGCSVVCIPFLDYGWQCEQDGISLMEFEHREFILRIEFIARRMIVGKGMAWDVEKSRIKNRLLDFKRAFSKIYHKGCVYEG